MHGSGGNPADFRFLIEGLDRSRYQPWVYFYPTGTRLERQSELLYHNDDAGSLASELDPRAQVAARRTFGFNEDHGGILSSPAVTQVVHTILSNSQVQVPWVERKIEQIAVTKI